MQVIPMGKLLDFDYFILVILSVLTNHTRNGAKNLNTMSRIYKNNV